MQATRFRQLVQERNWTMVETFNVHFATAAKQLAEQTGRAQLATIVVPRRTFDRWMCGALRGLPHRDTRLVLEHLLGEPAERLFSPTAADGTSQVPGRRPGRQVLGTLAQQFHGTGGAQEASSDEPLASPVGSTAPSIGLLRFDDPLDVITQARSLTRSNTEPALLDMAATSIQSIVDRYEMLGPQHLAGEARLLRQMLHTLLVGQQPPRVRTELFGLAARAAGLLGYMAVNAGAPFAVADAYCTEAAALAREAGKNSLEIWVAGTRSLGLYYAGRYDEADAAAQAGIGLAPQSPHTIRLLVNGRARALARLGDRAGTERTIGLALELSDRQSSLPEGLTSCIDFAPYSVARSLANAVTARLSLGDVADVLTYADQIDDLIERSDSEWSRALVRLDVATALLQQTYPEVEHAMALGRDALRAGTTAPIRSVWQRANELHERAARWQGEPEVKQYAEELRAWRSQPQAEPIAAGSGTRTAL